jgi:hypothetical protein
MIYWARRSFDDGDYTRAQELMGDLQIRLGAPHELMMFERHVPGSRSAEVFIGVPQREMLRIFDGFTEIAESELPDGLIGLVTRDDGFQERFPQIAAKLLKR